MTAEAEATAQAIVRLSATPSYATVTVLTAAPIATSTWTAKVKIATVVSDLNLETQTPTAGERRIAREVHNANADEQLSTREAYRPEPKPWTKVELADSWDDVIRLEPSPKGSIGGPFAGRMFEVGKYTDHFAKWVQVRFGRCGYRQSGEVCPSQADWGVKQSYCWTEEGNPIVTGGYWTNPKDSRSSVRSPCPRSHVTYWNPYDGYRK
ncbi:MAG: hypothetical protein OXC83_04060 [Chloroflexi bacterium]|nr:hypothetical protein [Chloroflexota bacterium]